MQIQESVAVSSLTLSICCFFSAWLIKNEWESQEAKTYFLLFYLCMLIFSGVTGLVPEGDSVFYQLLLDISAAGFCCSFILGLCKRHNHTGLFKLQLVVLVIYFMALFVTDYKIPLAYVFVLLCSAIGIYSICRRLSGPNLADKGIIAIQLLICGVVIRELGYIPVEVKDQVYREVYMENILIFMPVYIGGLTIFLISSYMLDANAKLLELAMHDPMTGLLNRRAMYDAIDASVHRLTRTNGNAVVVLADIDHFKLVNDTHGHDAGDKAIKHFANILKASLRKYDIVARYGGEEFLLFLPETSSETALGVAERIRADLESAAFVVGNSSIRLTASFGVAEFKINENVDANIALADKGLYAAKEAGRNRVVLHSPDGVVTQVTS